MNIVLIEAAYIRTVFGLFLFSFMVFGLQAHLTSHDCAAFDLTTNLELESKNRSFVRVTWKYNRYLKKYQPTISKNIE